MLAPLAAGPLTVALRNPPPARCVSRPAAAAVCGLARGERYNRVVASYYLRNFGCRTNQAEGAEIEAQLRAAGLLRAGAPTADFIVLNTCTVTAEADADARAAIRRIRRENPAARVLVTGCYAQRAPAELRALPGVEWVVGHAEKPALAQLLLPAEALGAPPLAHTELGGRTRPNVKVQDGCNNRCAFCVIPSVRGASRSLPLPDVLAAVERHAQAGVAEVVLTGINLGQWGRDLVPRQRFADLVRAVLDRTALPRLRLSSIEPMDWSDELLELLASAPRIAPHAHVPLQSGSDAVLRRMHRRYRPWHYAEKIWRIRERLPQAAIGADVMVGFPGETAAEFAETERFLAALPLTYLHVFTYSSRPGTEAARRAADPGWQPVAASVAAERSRQLHALAATKRAAFARACTGQPLEAVTLGDAHAGWTRALTGNYLDVLVQGELPPNRCIQVQIAAADAEPLRARLI